ncbi:MAG TPA: Gfo/Idh/MocA family oxidoreductase [Devosiaceae bacterium]|nr:Gfo/Idh/MocA family oxidoreductase [Devosiaceae bacterium]
MDKVYGVGVIGAGNISVQYLRFAPLFDRVEIRAIADILPEAAAARSAEFGLEARTVDGILSSDDIDVVINLTVPGAHYTVTSEIISAGKHAYSEKPLCLTLEEGKALREAAKAAGRQVGSAPDTFLGGSHQFARKLVDDGRVGRVASGTCHLMSRGMEHWHPNPDFFFQAGGGPIFDIGPYYITNLINLIGPARRVAALSGMAQSERMISSQPRAGETIKVETPTTVHALIEFQNGAIVTLGTSWDVFAHGHHDMELYGTEGTLFLPDPNFFSGDVVFGDKDGNRETLVAWNHPLGVPNQDRPSGEKVANYRSAGLVDMVRAVEEGRPARCSLDTALHAVDIMTSILRSGESGEFIEMTTTCVQPALLTPEEARAMLKARTA